MVVRFECVLPYAVVDTCKSKSQIITCTMYTNTTFRSLKGNIAVECAIPDLRIWDRDVAVGFDVDGHYG